MAIEIINIDNFMIIMFFGSIMYPKLVYVFSCLIKILILDKEIEKIVVILTSIVTSLA